MSIKINVTQEAAEDAIGVAELLAEQAVSRYARHGVPA